MSLDIKGLMITPEVQKYFTGNSSDISWILFNYETLALGDFSYAFLLLFFKRNSEHQLRGASH